VEAAVGAKKMSIVCLSFKWIQAMKFFQLFKLMFLLLPAILHATEPYSSKPSLTYRGMNGDGTHIAVLNTQNTFSFPSTLSRRATLVETPQFSKAAANCLAETFTYNPAQIKTLRERFESLASHNSIFKIAIRDSLYSDHIKAMTGATIGTLLSSKADITQKLTTLNNQFGFSNEFTRLDESYKSLQASSLKPLWDFIPSNMHEVYLKKGIENHEGKARIEGYELCLKFNEIALQKIGQQLKRLEEWNNQLSQAKKDLFAVGGQIDQALFKALDDKQLALQQMSKAISKEVGELLTHCKISPEAVNKLIGNSSQRYFFDKAHGIIADAAQLFAQYKNDPNICAYIQATAFSGAATIEMLRNGNVAEAIRHSMLSEILHASTHTAIHFCKGVADKPLTAAIGIGKGLVEVTVVGAVLTAGITACPAIGTGALTLAAGTAVYSLMYCDAKKIVDSINAFQKLSVDEQSKSITVLVTSIYNPLTKSSYTAPLIHNLERCIRRELVALSALHKVEQANLVTHKGVTFAKEFEQLLKPYIDSGKLTTQEDVIRYLSELEAPFLTSCKAAVEYVMPAAQEAAVATGMFKGAVHDVAQVKAGQEAIAIGSAGAQSAQQPMIARTDPMTQAGTQGSAQIKPPITAHTEPNVQLTATQKSVAEGTENISNLGTQSPTATGTVQPASKVVETIQSKWWEAYQNKWFGKTIKEFDAQKLGMRKIFTHTFLNEEHGLKKLGKTEAEILDKLINMVKVADSRSLLKNGLTNQVRTIINDLPVEVRIHIINGNPTSLNAFIGHPSRDLGNIVTI
jgi:ferritin-like metal-binding protein YciE